MKKRTICLFAGCLVFGSLFGTTFSASASESSELIRDIPTIQAFTDEAVAEEDIRSIVEAGINSPSAMNKQPWHFSVVTDLKILDEISGGMSGGMPSGMTPPSDKPITEESEDGESAAPAAPASSGVKAGITDAPLVIIVSCTEGSENDAGLSTSNMSAEAQLLGYGTKIATSPAIALNGERQDEFKELLSIPEDMSVAGVLLIGKTDMEAYHAVSSATGRNRLDDLVSYITAD